MRRLRALLPFLAVLLVADGALAASKHEETRRSASRKRHESRSAHHDHGPSDGGSDFLGSCLSGCFSAGCDVAGRVAVEGAAELARAAATPSPPPAPGLEPPPEAWPEEPAPGERWPEEDPEPRRRDLPEELLPPDPGDVPEDETAGGAPPWMPGPAESPAGFVDEGGPAPADAGAARVPVVARDAAGAGPGEREAAGVTSAAAEGSGAPAPRVPVRADENGPSSDEPDRRQLSREPDFGDRPPGVDSPEAFGVARAPAPPPSPPPASAGVEFDLRAAGAWIFADLPNASIDARATLRAKSPGPVLEAWHTGLWERIEGNWDDLPLGGLRLGFAFGTETVRPQLRFGGALLGLGPRDTVLGFDAGLGLELRTGGEGTPWIDLHGDALLFEGFTGTDFGGGVSFPGGPFYVRVGFRSLYLETFYAGPEIGLGLRL